VTFKGGIKRRGRSKRITGHVYVDHFTEKKNPKKGVPEKMWGERAKIGPTLPFLVHLPPPMKIRRGVRKSHAITSGVSNQYSPTGKERERDKVGTPTSISKQHY